MLDATTMLTRSIVLAAVLASPAYAAMANKTIAYDLDISPRTVELYRANAMRKLNARSLSEMLHIAFLAGMNGKAI